MTETAASTATAKWLHVDGNHGENHQDAEEIDAMKSVVEDMQLE